MFPPTWSRCLTSSISSVSNGTFLTNHHTPLISHTADDILTSLTGVYPSNHGQAVANSFGFFPLPGTSNFFDGFREFVHLLDRPREPHDRSRLQHDHRRRS